MGSFKKRDNQQGPDRRRSDKARRKGALQIESLEGRVLLDGGANGWKPTTSDLTDYRNGPMADVGQVLVNVYQAYLKGADSAALSRQFPYVKFSGNSVGVDVKGSGTFSTFIASLKNLGMQVTTSSSYYGLAEGYIPVAQLPTLARMTQTISAAPIYKPTTSAGPSPAPVVSYQGSADNEGLQSLNADTARLGSGLTGAGVTVGVLSDSAGQRGNGLADSIATGDLTSTATILAGQDGPAGSTDEGRAMMENIHDIAPGAKLTFATAFSGALGFGQNIVALAQSGAGVIVDDVTYLAEPFFQDGLISQGVNTAVNTYNASYFSSARNSSIDNGYLSTFRGVDASVGSLGSGHFMNFAPSGTAVTQLPITINEANTILQFQFDQPFFTEQAAGSTNDVTSEVDFYVLDASGNIVASGNSNNVATHEPTQILQVANPGSYTVAIQVKNGPDPGHVMFTRWAGGADNSLQVSQQFGNAGGTYYPASYGHNAGPNTIGVGAVPWWASAPFLNTSPLKSESFSSDGPNLSVRNPDGSLKATPVLTLNPSVSGPDGGNTSFFEGAPIDTSNPPFPGQPATTTNLSQNLPSFFGTSSAAPNVAAVAALIKQRTPLLSNEQIRSDLQAGARALNGATAGTWNAQGGYGLVDAVAALAAADVLRVANTTPASGSTLTTTPTQIIVTFNRPVDFSTVSASTLAFLTVPSALTNMTTGTPIALDDPRFPTQVAFPFNFTIAPNTIANGTFTYAIRGPVISKDGKALQDFNGSFNVADTMSPRVSNVTINGRLINVQFSEAMSQASIKSSTVFLALTDASGRILNVLNSDPRFKISYNTATNTATLDYSGLSQTQLPSGYYKIVVRGGNSDGNGGFEPAATDLVGNKLDGEFNGIFPSGEGDPKTPTNPTGRNSDENFVETTGFQTLTAPAFAAFKLVPSYDTGIVGDQNTNTNQPVFIGQIYSPFPGTVSGLTVLAEFNSLHGGNLDLAPLNGRGFTGSPDVSVTTDANGTFILPAPFLPEGFNRVRLVVIGQADSPPLPGLSTGLEQGFRIDKTTPQITGASLAVGGATLPLPSTNTDTTLNSLTTLSLNVVDPINPTTGSLSTPTQLYYSALNPATAANISNYELTNLNDNSNQSRFISSATFVPTGSDFVSAPNRATTSDPYFGRIDLTFAQGLPAGRYIFTAHTSESTGGVNYSGLTDAAGNPLDDSRTTGESTRSFKVVFDIQPQPTFIQSVYTNVNNAQGNTLLPRSYYEINPRAGDIVSAPPTTFFVDFSNPLDNTKDYSDAVQLLRTADSSTGQPDGDFGSLGVGGLGSSGTGFSRFNPAGTTVTLAANAFGTPNSRLILQLPAGTVLPADHYRLYLPNSGTTAIIDKYSNQLDGEFLSEPSTSGLDSNGNPAWEDLLPNGRYRAGMSGDGVAGGAFVTGFVVVPTGNIVYASPDYSEDPTLPSTTPDGSISRPYQVLAPQAAPNSLNSSTLNNGDPNGGLNSSANFLSGFNPVYDRAGIGKFARSAFYAASQLSSRGPVVVVALPGASQRDPLTGVVSQKTFVLQAPAGSDNVINDGSGSVPYDTLLVFNPGSTLKLQNASLFAQNQGSAIQAIGGANPNDRVNFTSYANDAVAGDTNKNGSNTVPFGGDWGGIVFRNFNQATHSTNDTFPIDVTLRQGPNGALAVSGADDSLSSLNFTNISYGGGAVPATQGTRYDEVTLYNSRPTLTNDTITGGPTNATAGSANGSQATISADFDSFREDDLGRGPLIRRTAVSGASLNGIWVRPLRSNGVAMATDAVGYAANPLRLGGTINYTFDDPLPYILTSVLDVGTSQPVDNIGVTNSTHARVYVSPGMLFKSEQGGGFRVLTTGASFIVGDRTYIKRWDAEATLGTDGLPTSTYSPNEANFTPNTTGDAQVVFTSALDNAATTSYFDPLTQITTTIVPAIDSLNTKGVDQPIAGNVSDNQRWGSIRIISGAYGTIDEANIRFGGGILNIPGGSDTDPEVLSFNGASTRFRFDPVTGQFITDTFGTRFMVTNNSFTDNKDAPTAITPNGLYAADTLRPLSSGAPFFRGNIFQRNGVNGLLVRGTGAGDRQNSNVDVNSLWDLTDLTYIVRNTIVLGGNFFGNGGTTTIPTSFQAEPKPSVVLTVQSALPGTLLANGQSIPRPGESVIIKLDNQGNAPPTSAQTQTGTVTTEDFAGAGFVAGVDNGVDPTADPTVDVGAKSQMRFLGIGGNETTGQSRVPVVITSVHDSTVGTTVRGVKLFSAIDGDATAPKAGDGGLIYFGGNELPDYSVLDPRGGSLIDNADIRYITRIEMQGGGIVNYTDANASNSFDAGDNPYATKGGSFPRLANGQVNPRSYAVQQNSEHAMTISDSNLSTFSDAGIIAHPGFNVIAGGIRSGIAGQPNLLFLVNNTIANMPIGVQMIGDPNADAAFPEANELLMLNNTLYNNPIAVDLEAIAFSPGTPQTRSHIHFVAMDNIFVGATTAVVQASGMLDGSQLQYNLFFNSKVLGGNQVVVQGPGAALDTAVQNFNPIFGDPQFRDAANGNFQLSPNSAAIDAGRSELTLNPSAAFDHYSGIFTTLLPVVNQQLNASGGIRNQTTRVPDFGQFDPTNPPTDQLSLPGSTSRGFVDEWFPTLPSDPQGIAGPTTVPGTWVYKPSLIPAGTLGVPGGGERDALGYLRIDNPNKPNLGFGSSPFFDIGAYEYRPLFPPHVTNVTATVATAGSTATTTIPFYKVGGISGTNQVIQTINATFDHQLDPSTITGATVLLESSGGDGIFGNNNSAGDQFYNLSGRLTFNASTNVLTISLGASGLSLPNDEYRLFVLGSGSTVIRDPQGNALDGENTLNDDPNNPQLALPSGDGFPGGNFYDSFIINTTTPGIVNGSFHLDTSTDSNVPYDAITNINKPSFTGTVTVTQPAINPLAGQTVIIDIATKGDGNFDILNAGTAFTDASGNFVVTVGTDAAGTGLVASGITVPDSPYVVGASGILTVPSSTGHTWARLRVIDTAGNQSNLTTDPYQAYAAKGALAQAIIDTTPPKITSFSPAPNTVLAPSGGKLTFTFTTDKNIDPSSLNASSLLVTRAGPDGMLGTADDVSVAVNASTIVVTPLGGGKGPESISFSVTGSPPNDLYAVTIKGTGASKLFDVAGNALDGIFSGTFPTGADNLPGSDFSTIFAVFSPSNVSTIFVGAASYVTDPTATKGAKANPYATIMAAMKAATAGTQIDVFPGVYTEQVSLKPFVKLYSAATSSTATSLVRGDALQTIIRAPAASATATSSNITLSGDYLPSIPGVDTEVAGFTIASPLSGDPALGQIDPNAIAVEFINSSVLFDHNYVIDANHGIHIVTTPGGPSSPDTATPKIYSNVIAGNITGILLDDRGSTSIPTLTAINNNTIAFNKFGVFAKTFSASPLIASLANDILWQNHDQTTARGGAGIYANNVGKIVVRGSLFSGNGASDISPVYSGINVGNGFNANLGSSPDNLGNFAGNPSFVAPRDPRPGSDGPATFILDANFNLTAKSAAIDAAINSLAPATDLLYRNRVKITGRGFTGTGPADIGAFEYNGTGGLTVGGGNFRVTTTSLAGDGSIHANGVAFSASAPPTSITVAFSSDVDVKSLTPSALILWGDGLNPVGPARATSVTVIDAHTVRFNLSGGFSSMGTVGVKINPGTIKSVKDVQIAGYLDTFKILPTSTTTTTTTTPIKTGPTTNIKATLAATTTPVASLTPAPAASPVTIAPTSVPKGPKARRAARLAAIAAKKHHLS